MFGVPPAPDSSCCGYSSILLQDFSNPRQSPVIELFLTDQLNASKKTCLFSFVLSEETEETADVVAMETEEPSVEQNLVTDVDQVVNEFNGL